MLQILRNQAQSIVMQAIVVIIALVFIFWGVGTNLMNNREAAIVVNGEEIDFQEFQIAYERAVDNIRNQFGGDLPQGLIESLNIKQQVINQLVQETLLRQGAHEMGVAVSAKEIQSYINEMAQFQDENGFSIDKYTMLLSVNNLSPQKFEQSVARDLLVEKASNLVSDFALSVTPYEVEELWKLDKSMVKVNYTAIKPEDYTATITPNEEELTTWYATVQDNYKTEPQVKLSYLDFSYDTIGDRITIDEESIEQYYQNNLSQYSVKEQRRARHILLKVEATSSDEDRQKQLKIAEEVLAAAKGGADFSELARKYSEGPSKSRGGDLGLFSRGQMVKPFEDAVFSLANPGDISDVVQTSFGYHIIKLEKIVEARTKPLAEVHDEIKKSLQNEQAKSLSFQLANQAYEGIIAAGSLEAYLAASPEITPVETEFFNRSAPPTAISREPKFLDAAFSLQKGELSSLVDTEEGYVILYAKDTLAPQVPEYETVANDVKADYIKAKSEELAKTSADTLLQQAKELNNLTEAAEKGGFTIKQSSYLQKNQQPDADFPQALIEQAFSLSGKEPYLEEPAKVGTTEYVLEYVESMDPQGSLSDQERERYTQALINLKKQQILSAYLKNLRQQAEVMQHKSL